MYMYIRMCLRACAHTSVQAPPVDFNGTGWTAAYWENCSSASIKHKQHEKLSRSSSLEFNIFKCFLVGYFIVYRSLKVAVQGLSFIAHPYTYIRTLQRY
jgi:hypothetical protein